jgi:large subunit ribosomal protein L30
MAQLKKTQTSARVRVTLIKSLNGRLAAHKACVQGLGLRKIGQTVDLPDTSEIRGMVNRVAYMLQINQG